MHALPDLMAGMNRVLAGNAGIVSFDHIRVLLEVVLYGNLDAFRVFGQFRQRYFDPLAIGGDGNGAYLVIVHLEFKGLGLVFALSDHDKLAIFAIVVGDVDYQVSCDRDVCFQVKARIRCVSLCDSRFIDTDFGSHF